MRAGLRYWSARLWIAPVASRVAPRHGHWASGRQPERTRCLSRQGLFGHDARALRKTSIQIELFERQYLKH
jgi:hypothetical protein